MTFGELGCGLPRFAVEVVDGRVTVLLNKDFDEATEALAGEESEAEPRPGGPDLGCPQS